MLWGLPRSAAQHHRSEEEQLLDELGLEQDERAHERAHKPVEDPSKGSDQSRHPSLQRPSLPASVVRGKGQVLRSRTATMRVDGCSPAIDGCDLGDVSRVHLGLSKVAVVARQRSTSVCPRQIVIGQRSTNGLKVRAGSGHCPIGSVGACALTFGGFAGLSRGATAGLRWLFDDPTPTEPIGQRPAQFAALKGTGMGGREVVEDDGSSSGSPRFTAGATLPDEVVNSRREGVGFVFGEGTLGSHGGRKHPS